MKTKLIMAFAVLLLFNIDSAFGVTQNITNYTQNPIDITALLTKQVRTKTIRNGEVIEKAQKERLSETVRINSNETKQVEFFPELCPATLIIRSTLGPALIEIEPDNQCKPYINIYSENGGYRTEFTTKFDI
ncbi:MAG: hypothetical protein WDZ41_05435 [Candidatus Babeliales bacterium]